ncbi:cell division protein FtsZ [Psychromonas sp. KJ10-10]|uniref:cell division protein FtsZ n=1 Tax=Psychromonas sp. KJ10-10 TaxID=3391823 RepID=UPI0039B54215
MENEPSEKKPLFTIIEDSQEQQAKIKVVGVGGGGSSAINHMITKGLTGVEFIVMNTDAQALRSSKADIRLQLGINITKGLGAGANPEIGYQSALESIDEIRNSLTGADVVFIAVGMGGGTGTGASPVVAEIAKELGALTIGVVSKPSFFEGNKRINYANKGITQLSLHIDSLLTIPNDQLKKVLPKGISFMDALAATNDVLYDAVSGFISIINDENGVINIDFADVKTIMSEVGTTAMMGTGISSGIENAHDRANEATQKALNCPLLEDIEISNARGVMGHITSGSTFTLDEYEIVGDMLKEIASPDARIILGVTIDHTLEQFNLNVTVILTGIGELLPDCTEASSPKKEVMKHNKLMKLNYLFQRN